MDIEGREVCKIANLSTGPPPNQKIMANRVADRVIYLERRMMGFAAALEQAHGITVSASLSVPCQVCAVCNAHNLGFWVQGAPECGPVGNDKRKLLSQMR
jgi:hypothetical protein